MVKVKDILLEFIVFENSDKKCTKLRKSDKLFKNSGLTLKIVTNSGNSVLGMRPVES